MKILLLIGLILGYCSLYSQPKILRECQYGDNGITYYLMETNYFAQANSHQYKSRLIHLGKWYISNNSLTLKNKEYESTYIPYNLEGVTIYVYDTVTFNLEHIRKEIQHDLYNHEIMKMLNPQDSQGYELVKLRILSTDILRDKFCSKGILIQYPYEQWNREKWTLRKIRKLEKRNLRINERRKK